MDSLKVIDSKRPIREADIHCGCWHGEPLRGQRHPANRFSPAVDPRFSYRGEDVVLTLERICTAVGYRKTIRVDQGSEFVSRDLDIWAYQKGVALDSSRPGKSTDNS